MYEHAILPQFARNRIHVEGTETKGATGPRFFLFPHCSILHECDHSLELLARPHHESVERLKGSNIARIKLGERDSRNLLLCALVKPET